MNREGATMKLAFGGIAAIVALVLSLGAAAAPGELTETVIYRFTGSYNSQPNSIVATPGGVLYGALGSDPGVFILTPPAKGQTQWTEIAIDAGGIVYGKLLPGKDGAIYGTTYAGGVDYEGAIFRLAPPGAGATQWTRTILHSFAHCCGSAPDGRMPSDGVIAGPGGSHRQ